MKNKMPKWFSSAVFYEIYPQSFMDSNADGIGDLKGIVSKLAYIKDLGCDAIWINPCFVSPFQDAGYDIADFYKVAPRYGSNADMSLLFKEAHKKGMHVILDLVPGHASIQHPWFKKSCEPARNKYTDWFIWTDNGFTSALPDYLSIPGYSDRNGQYVTNFFYSQPALNYGFAHPDSSKKWQQPYDAPGPRAVRAELRKIMRFWLDMGADGFRVDMAPSLVKGKKTLRYTDKLWGGIRRMLDRDYPEAFIISEWGKPDEAIRAGFHADFMLHFGPPAYTSLFRYEGGPENKKSFFNRRSGGDVSVFLDYYRGVLESVRGEGYVCIPSGNHDMTRIGRGRSEADLKVVFAFLLTMPGIPFIYYGDEIGMKYDAKAPNREGGFFRTGARTPMQWNSSQNMGFSKASAGKLYLPVGSRGPDVDSQIKTEGSLWQTVKRLVSLRRSTEALCADGAFKALYARPHACPFVYERSLAGQRYVIALNPSGKKVKASFAYKRITGSVFELNGSKNTMCVSKNHAVVAMAPVSYSIFKI